MLAPEAVVPALLCLAGEDAPTRTIACAGAGTFATAQVTLTHGRHIGSDAQAPERLAAAWAEVSDRSGETIPVNALGQSANEVALSKAARAKG